MRQQWSYSKVQNWLDRKHQGNLAGQLGCKDFHSKMVLIHLGNHRPTNTDCSVTWRTSINSLDILCRSHVVPCDHVNDKNPPVYEPLFSTYSVCASKWFWGDWSCQPAPISGAQRGAAEPPGQLEPRMEPQAHTKTAYYATPAVNKVICWCWKPFDLRSLCRSPQRYSAMFYLYRGKLGTEKLHVFLGLSVFNVQLCPPFNVNSKVSYYKSCC